MGSPAAASLAGVEVLVVVAPVYGTNCSIVCADPAPDGSRDCVVVDAGAGSADAVRRVVAERRLTPRAVLATHGHADHTWDAGALCAAYDVPFLLHAADAYRVDDPFGALGDYPVGVAGSFAGALLELGTSPEAYVRPARVETFGTPTADRDAPETLTAGAVTLTAVHAPGHTEGATLYLVDDAVVLAGDVLFAGSVGRTDLPGGDGARMQETLRDVVAHLDDDLAVLPGHGPTTTVARERATNPFLAGL